MTRLACPTCSALLDVPGMHGALVGCPCGAHLTVSVDVAGYHLTEIVPPRRIVDAATISLALEHWR